jgi:hypothetical protein
MEKRTSSINCSSSREPTDAETLPAWVSNVTRLLRSVDHRYCTQNQQLPEVAVSGLLMLPSFSCRQSSSAWHQSNPGA